MVRAGRLEFSDDQPVEPASHRYRATHHQHVRLNPRRITLSVLHYALFALAVWCVFLAIAGGFAALGESRLNAWQSEDRRPEFDEVHETFDIWLSALRFDRTNPHYLERYGQVYRWSVVKTPASEPFAINSNKRAIEWYQRAVERRPGWTEYWKSLVELHAALGHYDARLEQAMRNAARFGPWFRGNQATILSVGLPGYPFFSRQGREIVLETFDRAMSIQPRVAIGMALEANRSDWVEAAVKDDPALEKIYLRLQAERQKHAGQDR